MLIRCPHIDCRKYVSLTVKEAAKRSVLCPHCKRNLYARTEGLKVVYRRGRKK